MTVQVQVLKKTFVPRRGASALWTDPVWATVSYDPSHQPLDALGRPYPADRVRVVPA